MMTNFMSSGFVTNYGCLDCNKINKIKFCDVCEASVPWDFSVRCWSIQTGPLMHLMTPIFAAIRDCTCDPA